jgi:molecular chaperone GrpE
MSEENQNTNGSEKPANSTSSNEASFDISGEIGKLQEQAEKYKTDLLYLKAEFDNYRKNAIKERADLAKYGSERVIRDLLGVMDNFERALQTNVTPENFTTYKQGVEMTAAELKNVLAKNGVQEVPSQGQPFDPNVHEALSSEATDQVPPGHVVRVFQKAYKLHDKLVRPAQVVVAQKPNS